MGSKGFWSKLKDWQKGITLGILFSIILHLFTIFKGGNYFFQIGKIGSFTLSTLHFHFFPLSFFGPEDLLFQKTVSVLNFVAVTLWYSLIGFILGMLRSFLTDRPYLRKYITFIFPLLFAILILIVVLANRFIAISILSNLG